MSTRGHDYGQGGQVQKQAHFVPRTRKAATAKVARKVNQHNTAAALRRAEWRVMDNYIDATERREAHEAELKARKAATRKLAKRKPK